MDEMEEDGPVYFLRIQGNERLVQENQGWERKLKTQNDVVGVFKIRSENM